MGEYGESASAAGAPSKHARFDADEDVTEAMGDGE